MRDLQGFLEYGDPKQKKLTPAVKNAKRDVRAAVLSDVDELNSREIGERLGVPPPNFEVKGENETARKIADSGRCILEEAFGKEGWQERAKSVRADKAWWWSLSDAEKSKEIDIENMARNLHISIAEACRRVEQRDP